MFKGKGAIRGVPSKYIRDIVDHRISAEVYEVKPSKPLERGEYAFYFSGGKGLQSTGGVMAAAMGRLYPFGLD